MTLDEAIKHCLDIADGQDKCAEISVSEHAKERISQCAADHRQLAEWLTELKELSLQIAAPRLDSIEEYHYELARCKAAFWSCNKRCMDAEEQYRRKADELKKAQEQIAEYKRLLKAAVEDFETIESNLEYDEHCVIKTHSIRCDECPLSAETIYRCKWRYADEALALIGQDGDTNG